MTSKTMPVRLTAARRWASIGLFSQELERLVPVVGGRRREQPHEAHGLEVMRGRNRSDIHDIPAEVLADLRGLLLSPRVVPADEHARRTPGELRPEEQGVADGVEGLDDVGLRQ